MIFTGNYMKASSPSAKGLARSSQLHSCKRCSFRPVADSFRLDGTGKAKGYSLCNPLARNVAVFQAKG